MDKIMSVSVLVPRERIPELYAQCSRWLDEFEEGEREATEVRTWNSDDKDSMLDASTLYWMVSEGARKALNILMDAEDLEVRAEDLAKQMDLGNDVQKVSGTLSSVSRRAKQMQRPAPYDYDRERGTYSIDSEASRLFQTVREYGPTKQIPRGVKRLGEA